jgi:hypothetical protein
VYVNCISCPADAVAELGHVPSITTLHLAGGVKLDDSSVGSLTGLPRLETLTLMIYRLDANEILATHLPRFRKLKKLGISGLTLDDKVIDAVVGMNSLETLELSYSRIEKKQVVELRARRPDLTIELGNLPPFRNGKESYKDRKIILPKEKGPK